MKLSKMVRIKQFNTGLRLKDMRTFRNILIISTNEELIKVIKLTMLAIKSRISKKQKQNLNLYNTMDQFIDGFNNNNK